MEILGQAPVSPEIYRSAVRRLGKKTFLRVRLAGVLLTAVGLLFLLTNFGSMYVGIAFLAAGLTSATFTPFQLLRKTVRQAAPALAQPWRYTIGADGITIDTGLARTEWRWATLNRAEEFPEFWLLRTTMKNHGLIVVKRAFSPEDQLAVAQELQQRGLAASAAPALVA